MSQGRADDLEAPDGSVEQSRTTKGAEELRVDSGDKADELDGFDSGGGRGRLGETIHEEVDLELGNEDLMLCLNSDNLELGITSDDLNGLDYLELDGISGD